jgi:hypothetical protein
VDTTFFPYRAEPVRPALLVALPLIFASAMLPAAARPVLFAAAGGPLLWALLQVLRRGRGVHLGHTGLIVERGLFGRPTPVSFVALRGCATTRSGGLALLWHEPSGHPNPLIATSDAPALTALTATTDPDSPPRQRLILTAPLADSEALRAAIADRCAPEALAPEAVMVSLIRRRRLRNVMLLIIALLGTPLYTIIVLRILSSLL